MIKVKYEVDKSVPPDRDLILFDRNAFQCLPEELLRKINKKYNILCPIHFVVECIAPNNSDKKDMALFEKEKKALREKLDLIENPIVFTGSTNVQKRIIPPHNIKDNEYIDILASWQIARNCIINLPVTMKSISPDELVSKCNTNTWYLKHERRLSIEFSNEIKGTLTPKQQREQIQKQEQSQGRLRTPYEIKQELRKNPSTNITQELSNAAGHALRDIKNESKNEVIINVKDHFGLNNRHIEKLRSQIRSNKKLTIENYPRLSYPIYIYFLIRYMVNGIQQNAEHLDDSYFLDFQYFRYLNFCDRFIADETSTPHIVKAIPYSQISNIPIRTSEELVKELV